MDIDITLQLLDNNVRRTRGDHIDRTLVVGKLCHRELILVAAVAINEALGNKRINNIAHHISSLLRVAARHCHQLFEREDTFGKLSEHIYDKRRANALRINLIGSTT